MKKTIKIISINIIIVLLLLVLIDPFFQEKTVSPYVKPPTIKRSVILKEFFPNIELNRTPSDDYMLNTENLEQKSFRLRTDHNGFIIGDNDLYIENANATPDIVFFGGSTTECFFVDENKRFPYLVGEKLITSNSNQKIKVLNGGKSGNQSFHSTINLLAKGIPLNPKVVVLMHNINDLALLSKTGDYSVAPKKRAIIQAQKARHKKSNPSYKKRIRSFLQASRNLFFPNIYKRVERAINDDKKENNKTDEWEKFRRQKRAINYETLEKKFEQSIYAFINVARSYDIDVVLMTQFNRLNPDDDFIRKIYNTNVFELSNKNGIDYDTFCKYYKGFNDKLREIAAKEDLLLIDLEKQVPATSDYIYDPIHLNTKGSELVAEMIANELQNYYSNFTMR